MGATESHPQSELQTSHTSFHEKAQSEAAQQDAQRNRGHHKTKSSSSSHGRLVPKHDLMEYQLTIHLRGATKTGKTALRKRLYGDDFDMNSYIPSAQTEEYIINWMYYSQQTQRESNTLVKIVDVCDYDQTGNSLISLNTLTCNDFFVYRL